VFRYLQQFNPAKSPAPNNIPRKYIKLSSHIIAPILTNTYNKCVESGSYPDILIIAQVVQYIKMAPKINVATISSYHFSALFLKIFEKYLQTWSIYTNFDKYKILFPNQFGFKEKSSTSDAVRELFY